MNNLIKQQPQAGAYFKGAAQADFTFEEVTE